MLDLPFYPNYEYGCEQVKSCLHLGGASLGTLVMALVTAVKRFFSFTASSMLDLIQMLII